MNETKVSMYQQFVRAHKITPVLLLHRRHMTPQVSFFSVQKLHSTQTFSKSSSYIHFFNDSPWFYSNIMSHFSSSQPSQLPPPTALHIIVVANAQLQQVAVCPHAVANGMQRATPWILQVVEVADIFIVPAGGLRCAHPNQEIHGLYWFILINIG